MTPGERSRPLRRCGARRKQLRVCKSPYALCRFQSSPRMPLSQGWGGGKRNELEMTDLPISCVLHILSSLLAWLIMQMSFRGNAILAKTITIVSDTRGE